RLISPSPEHLRVVREGMFRVVHGPGGTARVISHNLPYTIAGKTGTAQVISRRGTANLDPKKLPMHLRHRALFICYAPAEAPTIAVAVVVEGGGYGASTAAPIARTILDAWLLGKMPEEPEKTEPAQTPAAGAPAQAATATPAGSTTAATTAAATTNAVASAASPAPSPDAKTPAAAVPTPNAPAKTPANTPPKTPTRP
nr:penicillin-binding protein 2 [Xanthomonadaceae bacterium]